MKDVNEVPAPVAGTARRAATNKAFARADEAWPFGPTFFLKELGRFLRDHCKDTAEKQSRVYLRLGDGTTLEVCSIVGVAPQWVVIAIDQASGPREHIAMEFVPYDLIRRVEVSSRPGEATSIGFSQTRAPKVISPETAVSVPAVDPVAAAESAE